MNEVRLNFSGNTSPEEQGDERKTPHRSVGKWMAISAGVLVGVASISGGAYWYAKRPPKAPATAVQGVSDQVRIKNYTANDIPFTLEQPRSLEEVVVSDQDQKDGIITRFQPSDHSISGLITVRWESRLRLAANASKSTPLEHIADSVARAFPQQYPSFKKLSDETININGKQAYKMEYAYDSKGTSIKAEFVAVMADDDTAIYMTFQSKADEFDQRKSEFFDTLANSIKIQ